MALSIVLDWIAFNIGIAVVSGAATSAYLFRTKRRSGASRARKRADLARKDPPTHAAVFKMRDFEAVRGSLGYERSNRLMRVQAERLLGALPGCVIGRVGRTTVEAAFSIRNATKVHASLASAHAFLQAPHRLDGIDISLTVDCGAAVLASGLVDDEALDRAAGALARAQARHQSIGIDAGGDRTADSVGDYELARALHQAIEHDGVELHYQPKFNCRDDQVRAVEALLRWEHPALGRFSTDRVIAAAERLGMIPALTEWVVNRAIRDRGRLAAAGHDITIFVNLSGPLLANRTFVDQLISLGSGGGIGFEITETAVIADPEDAIYNVTRISEAGIPIAIDDYGSGLSSLAYLKQLPAHELKIDRMFVKELTESHRDPLLVRSSIDLAHALDMQVTAEGVEDAMTLSLLRIMGCDAIQGYLISPALPLPELVKFLAESGRLGGLGRAPLALPDADEQATRAQHIR